MLVVLFLRVTLGSAPECRYACDDPVCPAVCRAECKPARCEYECDPSEPHAVCSPPICHTHCTSALDSSPSDSCPSCETRCEPLRCRGNVMPCHTLCEALECTWNCQKPRNCPRPRCELMCEQPACASEPRAPATRSSIAVGAILLSLMLAAI